MTGLCTPGGILHPNLFLNVHTSRQQCVRMRQGLVCKADQSSERFYMPKKSKKQKKLVFKCACPKNQHACRTGPPSPFLNVQGRFSLMALWKQSNIPENLKCIYLVSRYHLWWYLLPKTERHGLKNLNLFLGGANFCKVNTWCYNCSIAIKYL